MAHVYILRCADDSYYVGSTTDLERRLWEHNNSDAGAAYTRKRRPVILVWSEFNPSIEAAFAAEKQIQNWSRKKREALIRGDREALRKASRRKAVQDRQEP